jgi:hypothetical protein
MSPFRRQATGLNWRAVPLNYGKPSQRATNLGRCRCRKPEAGIWRTTVRVKGEHVEGTRTGDAQSDGGKVDHYSLNQRRARAPEGLDATMHDELADRLADLNAHRVIGVGNDAVELRKVHRPGVDIEAALWPKVSIGALTFSSCTMPKLTKPMPLGPYEVIFASAVT